MTDREKKLNTDREWLADELMHAGSPALPSSLSAAALFERMDAEEQKAAEPAAPAPEKKGGVIWLQWRRWGGGAGAGGGRGVPAAKRHAAEKVLQ